MAGAGKGTGPLLDSVRESNSNYDNRLMIGLLVAVLIVSLGVVYTVTSDLV